MENELDYVNKSIVSLTAWDLLDNFKNGYLNYIERADIESFVKSEREIFEYIAKLEKIAGIDCTKDEIPL